MNKNLLICIPCFNEYSILPQSHAKLTSYLKKLDIKNILLSIDILYVDDGSNDNTWNIVKDLTSKDITSDIRVSGLKLSKNFGKDSAIFFGIKDKIFDAYLIIDADNEHPFNLIPEIIKHWLVDNFEIVECVRFNTHSFFNNLKTKIYINSLKYLAGLKISSNNITDFKLIDKKVYDHIFSTFISPRYWKLVTISLKFKHKILFFKYLKNDKKIKSSFNFFSLFKLYLEHIFYFSIRGFSILFFLLFLVFIITVTFMYFDFYKISFFLIFFIFIFSYFFYFLLSKFHKKNLYKENEENFIKIGHLYNNTN